MATKRVQSDEEQEEDRPRKGRRQRPPAQTPDGGINELLVALYEEVQQGNETLERIADALESLAETHEELVDAAVYEVDKKTKIVGVSVNRSSDVHGEQPDDEEPE